MLIFHNNFDFLSWVSTFNTIEDYHEARQEGTHLEEFNPQGFPNRINLTTSLREYMLRGDLIAVEILQDHDIPIERRHIHLLLNYPEDSEVGKNLFASIKLWFNRCDALKERWIVYENLGLNMPTLVNLICDDLFKPTIAIDIQDEVSFSLV